jgi:hypothetical protein
MEIIAVPLIQPVPRQICKTALGLYTFFSKLAKDPIGCQPWKFILAEIGTMTAPRIFAGISNHAAPNRVKVNIPHQFQKIALAINQQSLKTPLEKMPASIVPAVVPLSVAKRKILHAPGERDIAHLQKEVKMIGHETKGMDTISKPGRTLLQEKKKATIIFIRQKNILPAIAPQHDVINSAGNMDAWFACHGFIIRSKCFLSTWKPDPVPLSVNINAGLSLQETGINKRL